MMNLAEENKQLRAEIFVLKERITQLERLVFGSRRERFEPTTDPSQGQLFEGKTTIAPVVIEEEKRVVVKAKKNRKGIKCNIFPAHLQRLEETLEVDTSHLIDPVKIGEDITELLSYKPAEIRVKKIVRPRYADQADEDKGVLQQAIPSRLIPKGMVDESLIAQIIVEKIQFHMPVYRFAKKLRQLGIDFIKQNNLHNWLHRGASALVPLYHLLQEEVLATGYVQGDETHIKVLAKNKVGAAHRGQMWVFFAPEILAVLFNYEPTRSEQAANQILADYQGILQTDGYKVYQSIAQKNKIELTHCMAHARRKFFEAKNNEPQLANHFLRVVQQLYEIEDRARAQKLSAEKRLSLRQKEAVPLLKALEKWLQAKSGDRTILPKSMIRKAIDYTLKLWKGLSAYAQDGRLEIDNNLVENTIRPVALGRKNYLFAGSHDAAQNLAILYSLMGSCEKNNINPFKYFNWVLKKVAAEKVTPQAVEWLPHRIDPKMLETSI